MDNKIAESCHLLKLFLHVYRYLCYTLCISGEAHVYKSHDSGDVRSLGSCNGLKELHLKIGAPVILTVNLSSKLVNGLRGTVLSFQDQSVSIDFPSIHTTQNIEMFTFTVYSPTEKRNIATRKQIPLRLAFAFTVHRAQGLTLERVQVDCQNMFNPGQIGVAVGRAIDKKGLRVLNFSEKLLSPQPLPLQNFYSSTSLPLQDSCKCCKKVISMPTTQESPDKYNAAVDDDDDDDDDNDDDFDDEELTSHVIQLEHNLNQLEQLQSHSDVPVEFEIPEEIHLDQIIKNIRYDMPQTEKHHLLNKALDYMLEQMTNTTKFAQELWSSVQGMFNRCIPVGQVLNKHTTAFYKEVTSFQQSDIYKGKVKLLFNTSMPKPEHYRACFAILQALKDNIISIAVEGIKEQSKSNIPEGKIYTGSKGGRSKLRYIAGWCVATLKYRKKQFVSRNLYKKSTRAITMQVDQEVKLLQHLTEGEAYLLRTSTDQDSLLHVKQKQNLRGGLTHISDSAFNYFESLDVNFQKIENESNLNLHGKNFYSFIQTEVQNNSELFAKWEQIFENICITDIESQPSPSSDVLRSLHCEIIAKYIMMSSSQFRRDYLRKMKVNKEEAHRKQIHMKGKETKSQKTLSKWGIEEIMNDESTNRMVSHRRMQSELEADANYLSPTYKKDHLLLLCKAYGVIVKKSATKDIICDILRPQIMKMDKMAQPMLLVRGGELAEPGPSTATSSISTCTTQAEGDSLKETGKGLKRKVKGTGKSIPKVKKIKWPCGKCGKESVTDCVACDQCDMWFHLDCLGLKCSELEDEWYCDRCRESRDKP